MISIFNNHYKAIEKRGKINPSTKLIDFVMKMEEELCEFADEKDPNKQVQEAIDLMCVCANFVKWSGYDLKEELKKNVNHQNNRDD